MLNFHVGCSRTIHAIPQAGRISGGQDEVPEISSQDRILQRTVEQILNETVDAVRSAPRERKQQRTAEQSVDVPQLREHDYFSC